MATSVRPPSMVPALPRVRGRFMQTFAAHVDRLPPEDRARVRELVPAAVWADIAAAGGLSWLPFDVNLGCTRAVADVLGARRTHDFFVSLTLTTFKTPLLQSLVDAVLRMLGSDPGVSLSWVSKGFELMFKDVGAWAVLGREEHSASLEVRRLPPAAVNDRIWLQSVASSLCALFVIAGVEGATTLREVEPERGRVVFRARWGAK